MEKDIGKIKKNDDTDIVIRIDDFGGNVGLTIREFVTGDRYTGFTKKGTRIPASSIPEFKEMINSIKDEDLNLGETSEPSNEETEKVSEEKIGKAGKKKAKDEKSDEEIEEVTL
jgi:hypothetical protein